MRKLFVNLKNKDFDDLSAIVKKSNDYDNTKYETKKKKDHDEIEEIENFINLNN